ncbi:hypothetical protein GCM10025865_15170 [Paraoerskovia sediminicola]|uniref:STAS domain-containing protein n=1 Tax=Paraoerskovia sediminicola TaxID=1138587 RepID=A0ABM8G2J8_9CELL|nr:STAS domain-containing protein [Paraoerskovia sediminicola]BDZ42218.1 hypothetical protein GCM10025865_15170 [Paraoerskovia sediminicola]
MTDNPVAGGIEAVATSDGALVTMWGDVDASLRTSASEAMTFLALHEGPVAFDVARVDFIDSTGLAFILQAHLLCLESGHEVVLHDPPPRVVHGLEMIGMGGRIPVSRTAGSGAL